MSYPTYFSQLNNLVKSILRSASIYSKAIISFLSSSSFKPWRIQSRYKAGTIYLLKIQLFEALFHEYAK